MLELNMTDMLCLKLIVNIQDAWTYIEQYK